MAVRSFQQIMDAHAASKKPHVNVPHTVTVYQGRDHAPKQPSFNQRGAVHDSVVVESSPANAGATFADEAAARGLITPHQRYEIAMQRDIG